MPNACDNLPAEAYELGELKDDFRVCQSGIVAAGILVVAILCGAVVALWWSLAVAIAAFCSALAGACFVAKLYRQRHLRFLIVEEGLVCFRRGKFHVCRWDQVQAMTEDRNDVGSGSLRWELELRCSGGESLGIDFRHDPVDRYALLVESIAQTVTERLRQPAEAALSAGQTLEFGDVQLSPRGVSYRGKSIAWDEVREIKEDWNSIRVEKCSGWLTWAQIPWKVILNRRLLITLAQKRITASELAAAT